MSYEKVIQAKSVIIGTKQAVRALKNNLIQEVIIADDADIYLTGRVVETAKELDVPITYVDSMRMLGKACGIDVGAATVAIKK
ncbi:MULTISPECIES: 50S ribosomal protein L7ae-like protein [Bacillales]|jgi:large subunit ribosomal protein L7A|uniref:RNA-binding protein BN1180_05505 n=5 Tax=Peribacillus TaxID=2675229 RepID=A0A098EQW6_9BACI|nr:MULTISPECIES: 50S ribosomal protein L7ae-like protein [Bacillales]KOR81353.1 ribosomal protein L7Ae-like protein [Bacillus sp. FJAT-21352]KOR84962.1 ribosomal protein L7Ae-like protein [Bacillus sp. FJAT-22058]KQU23996.1 ribosomal protein L7Ae-like protein [Bacillus sp. Leaf13]KRF58378.1 ribosomal protein L7Ae-like protein [Bacillus sp. Soil745]KRF64847.1 ribosomal protein L7Ae-like protein [Bacillus sp. Soil768D1]MBD8138464.1 50S ribosomal protein L7ae-like protein [Bacillus sp. CFBP 1359